MALTYQVFGVLISYAPSELYPYVVVSFFVFGLAASSSLIDWLGALAADTLLHQPTTEELADCCISCCCDRHSRDGVNKNVGGLSCGLPHIVLLSNSGVPCGACGDGNSRLWMSGLRIRSLRPRGVGPHVPLFGL